MHEAGEDGAALRRERIVMAAHAALFAALLAATAAALAQAEGPLPAELVHWPPNDWPRN